MMMPHAAAKLRRFAVHADARVPHPLGELASDEPRRRFEVDVLVVRAGLGLGRGGEDDLGQLVRLPQTGRQADSAYRPGALVVFPPRADEVAAHDGLDRQRSETTHDHGLIRDRRPDFGVRDEVLEPERCAMVAHDPFDAREPEARQPRQHGALARDGVGEHHVERRQPVRGHDEQMLVPGRVDVAHLAAPDQIQAWNVGFKDSLHDHRVSWVSGTGGGEGRDHTSGRSYLKTRARSGHLERGRGDHRRIRTRTA